MLQRRGGAEEERTGCRVVGEAGKEGQGSARVPSKLVRVPRVAPAPSTCAWPMPPSVVGAVRVLPFPRGPRVVRGLQDIAVVTVVWGRRESVLRARRRVDGRGGGGLTLQGGEEREGQLSLASLVSRVESTFPIEAEVAEYLRPRSDVQRRRRRGDLSNLWLLSPPTT